MEIRVFEDKQRLGSAAAREAADTIRAAIKQRGEACVLAATGTSQLEMLDALVREPIDWRRTTFFHLDEYIGLPADHPASFRRYLKERIGDRVNPGEFVFIEADRPDPAAECRRLGRLLAGRQIDLALVGIGENGHLAFNDPPADFDTGEPYLIVELDETCRRQQVGEGWFADLEEVPRRAITMSIPQILRAEKIVCVVTERRKARILKKCLEEEVSPRFPASILRRHPRVLMFLDREAASDL